MQNWPPRTANLEGDYLLQSFWTISEIIKWPPSNINKHENLTQKAFHKPSPLWDPRCNNSQAKIAKLEGNYLLQPFLTTSKTIKQPSGVNKHQSSPQKSLPQTQPIVSATMQNWPTGTTKLEGDDLLWSFRTMSEIIKWPLSNVNKHEISTQQRRSTNSDYFETYDA